MVKPKPCPVCGESPYINGIIFSAPTAAKYTNAGSPSHIKRYRVLCDHQRCLCHPQTRLFSTPEEAIEAWNRRVDNG